MSGGGRDDRLEPVPERSSWSLFTVSRKTSTREQRLRGGGAPDGAPTHKSKSWFGGALGRTQSLDEGDVSHPQSARHSRASSMDDNHTLPSEPEHEPARQGHRRHRSFTSFFRNRMGLRRGSGSVGSADELEGSLYASDTGTGPNSSRGTGGGSGGAPAPGSAPRTPVVPNYGAHAPSARPSPASAPGTSSLSCFGIGMRDAKPSADDERVVSMHATTSAAALAAWNGTALAARTPSTSAAPEATTSAGAFGAAAVNGDTAAGEGSVSVSVATTTTIRVLPPARAVGIRNVGNTCFVSAALQCLRHTPGLVTGLDPALPDRVASSLAAAGGGAETLAPAAVAEETPGSVDVHALARASTDRSGAMEEAASGLSERRGEAATSPTGAGKNNSSLAAVVEEGVELKGASTVANGTGVWSCSNDDASEDDDNGCQSMDAEPVASESPMETEPTETRNRAQSEAAPGSAADPSEAATGDAADRSTTTDEVSELAHAADTDPPAPEADTSMADADADEREQQPAITAGMSGAEPVEKGTAGPGDDNQGTPVPSGAPSPAAPAAKIPPKPARPEKGELLAAFNQLVLDYYTQKGNASLDPLDFIRTLRAFPIAMEFLDGGQHDCQEVLRVMMDLLHDDVKPVSNGKATNGPGVAGAAAESPAPTPTGSSTPVPPPAVANGSASPASAPVSLPVPPLAVPLPPASPPQPESEVEKGDRHWREYLTRDSSPITKLFGGQLQSSVTCHKCGGRFTMYEPFWDLSLPLAKEGKQSSLSWLGIKGTPASITDCLSVFTADEKLEGEEAFHCEKCRAKTPATKHLRVHRLPQILVLHIKRFKYRGFFTDKLTASVSYPLAGLSLDSFLSPEALAGGAGGAAYDLYAVSNHYGNLTGGHYTAMCRSLGVGATAGDWYCFNDEVVNRVSDDQVVSQYAYILFYARRPTV